MPATFSAAANQLAETGDAQSMLSVAQLAPAVTNEELAELATVLAQSGSLLRRMSDDQVDIASTGGPGSLSTLLAPLYAMASGARVSKIAVPGRPAGGLDVLGSLSGFDTRITASRAEEILADIGYLHTAAGHEFCPLDATFFKWRQVHGYQAVPALAIASLLSKKLAAGLSRVCLDVRVGPHGNLGTTREAARANALRFNAVAAELGISAVCRISEGRGPAQPWIGRGEALLAMGDLLDGSQDPLLAPHGVACREMAELATGSNDLSAVTDRARDGHDMMLAAHGCRPNTFWERTEEVRAALRRPIRATSAGYFRIDLAGVRSVLVAHQALDSPTPGAHFSDPCGLRLCVHNGSAVDFGAILAEVREDSTNSVADELSQHLQVLAQPLDTGDGGVVEIIDG